MTRKKWPEHLVIVDEMRVTSTGKLDKKAMAEVAVAALRPTSMAIALPQCTANAALCCAAATAVSSDVPRHGAAAGAWFDRASDALILDQRALWMLLFLVLIVKGAGPLSADRLLAGAAPRLAA